MVVIKNDSPDRRGYEETLKEPTTPPLRERVVAGAKTLAKVALGIGIGLGVCYAASELVDDLVLGKKEAIRNARSRLVNASQGDLNTKDLQTPLGVRHWLSEGFRMQCNKGFCFHAPTDKLRRDGFDKYDLIKQGSEELDNLSGFGSDFKFMTLAGKIEDVVSSTFKFFNDSHARLSGNSPCTALIALPGTDLITLPDTDPKVDSFCPKVTESLSSCTALLTLPDLDPKAGCS